MPIEIGIKASTVLPLFGKGCWKGIDLYQANEYRELNHQYISSDH